MEIDKIALLYIKNKKLLSTISKGKTVLYIPGGKREQGESDQQALIREIKEELLVELLPETIKYYGTFKAQAHGKPTGVNVKMTCYTADFVGEIKPSAEIEKTEWIDSNAIDTIGLPPVDVLILKDLKSKDLID